MISFNFIAMEEMKENIEQNYDLSYYNQQHDLNHLNDYGKMILEILIITRDSLWKEITEASKIHCQLNKDNQDEIFKKYSNWPKDKQMQGYMGKLTYGKHCTRIGNYQLKLILRLTASSSPLSNKYFQWKEYNNIIDCFIFNQKLEEKSEKFIKILQSFFKRAAIFDFDFMNKYDSHMPKIVNRINDISEYCSLENNMELYYINNVKNIIKNIKDPLECLNIISLYIKSFTKLTDDKRNITILSLMIDKIKDDYSLEEKLAFDDIMDKIMNNNEIYSVISDDAWQLMRLLTHKEINNIQLLKIIIDNTINNTKDPLGGMAKIRRYTFCHEKIYELSLKLEGYNRFTNDKIAIINQNIMELSKSDKEDRKFI